VGIRIVTPPTVAPIDVLGLASLKQHVNEAADVTDNDALIATYCQVAWDYCERYSWRTLLTKQLCLSLRGWFVNFGESYRFKCSTIPLPRPQVVSIESVEYYDEDNTLQTLATDDWAFDGNCDVVEIEIYNCPSLYDRPDAVHINYTAGYGNAEADFPSVLLHAVRLLVGDYYRTREPAAADLGTVNALLEAIEIRDERLTVYE
jgi:uncharacterized phiE125 gp8 family phage protein